MRQACCYTSYIIPDSAAVVNLAGGKEKERPDASSGTDTPEKALDRHQAEGLESI
jgi:hypothetical protein